jgi:signal transduction histidine kinase/tetratricopeptide (TPR) repeat protein
MISNLKIAIKKQKKLITLFLLTILLPSVILSIFGIRAIQNERFKVAQQYEVEHKRIADLLKQSIISKLKDIQNLLTNLANEPVVYQKNYEGIRKLLDNDQIKHSLIEQFIIIYKSENAFFPFFPLSTTAATRLEQFSLSKEHKEIFKTAEKNEYIHKNYSRAITEYNELFVNIKNKGDQAQMLNNIGRNLIKQNNYRRAMKVYNRVIDEYSDQKTSSSVPLTIIAHLQLIECYQQVEDIEKALKIALILYRKILNHTVHLTDDQFFTYAKIIKEKISSLIATISSGESYRPEFENLNSLYSDKCKQWIIVGKLKTVCIPELREKFMSANPGSLNAYYYSRTINQKSYLLSGVLISDQQKRSTVGSLIVKLNNHDLEGRFLKEMMSTIPLSKNTMINIFDLSGNMLFGHNSHSEEYYKIASFFEDNFPPWGIEIADTQAGDHNTFLIQKSFYFWTILTLLVVLICGLILIVKTVSHEMDILKIKSDFVSSVSHEFKTPLTSIQVLTERLREGKVKDPEKKQQYYSVISQDTEKLSRLVGNILNLSKIEEGKYLYEFEDTDLSQWLPQIIDNFKNENLQREVKISTNIPAKMPSIKIDKNAIAQAFYNLLDNAVKFSAEKENVEVLVKQKTDDLVIQIKDRGIGIPRSECDKIFEKFYQGEKAIKYSSRGTGLGLTLVKHTVEAHGGKISVQSQEGQGSTFFLILPIMNNMV